MKKLSVFFICAIAGLILGMSTVSTSASSNNMVSNKVIKHKSFGSWGYQATQEGDNPYITVNVESNIKTKTELREFLSAQKIQKNKVFKKNQLVRGLVILSTPMSAQEIRNLVARNNLTVDSYRIIAVSGEDVITIFGAPDQHDVFPEYHLKDMIKSVEKTQIVCSK